MRNIQMINWEAKTELSILNLDVMFAPVKARGFAVDFKKFKFPSGESHIILNVDDNPKGELVITQRVNQPGDIIDILLANDAAQRLGYGPIHLFLPFFPGARQDRVCERGEALTAKVMADMINSCNFASVSILCPHSDVITALINNVWVMDDMPYIQMALRDISTSALNVVCPDAGAGKRIGKIVSKIDRDNVELIKCDKVRDTKTGALTGFSVYSDDLRGAPTIIIDDINCKGGTFIGLAKELREKNCGSLMLFTTHADCVEGVQNVVECFDHYYTTNSKKNWGEFGYTLENKFTCFNISL